eukprot:jgi/Chlat1/47/ChrspC238589S00926
MTVSTLAHCLSLPCQGLQRQSLPACRRLHKPASVKRVRQSTLVAPHAASSASSDGSNLAPVSAPGGAYFAPDNSSTDDCFKPVETPMGNYFGNTGKESDFAKDMEGTRWGSWTSHARPRGAPNAAGPQSVPDNLAAVDAPGKLPCGKYFAPAGDEQPTNMVVEESDQGRWFNPTGTESNFTGNSTTWGAQATVERERGELNTAGPGPQGQMAAVDTPKGGYFTPAPPPSEDCIQPVDDELGRWYAPTGSESTFEGESTTWGQDTRQPARDAQVNAAGPSTQQGEMAPTDAPLGSYFAPEVSSAESPEVMSPVQSDKGNYYIPKDGDDVASNASKPSDSGGRWGSWTSHTSK